MGKFARVRVNLVWQLIYQVTILLLGFILPRFVMTAYGSDVNGLTSTIKQVIIIVALANAGISTAVTYSLYKPVADNNRIKIAETINGVNIVFSRISILTLFLGVAASAILAFVQKGELEWFHVFIACFLTCLQTVLGLRFTSAYSTFFTATQNKHIISIGLLLSGVIMYCGEILLAVLRVHYIWLYACPVIGCIAQIIFLRISFKKKYKPYELQPGEQIANTDLALNGMGYATMNEIAHSAVMASQTIIISTLCGFAEASVFSVYMMVVNALSLIAQVVYTSFAPSFGAVVAEGNIAKTNQVFEIFQFLLMMLTAFLYMCAVYLMMPFVKIYTTGVDDINYISRTLMTLAIIHGIFYATRVPYNIVVSSHGLFEKSAKQTAITAVFAILISVIAALNDFSFVLLGPVVFYMTNAIYQHFMLRKNIAGFDNSRFARHLLVIASGVGIMALVSIFLPNYIASASFGSWIVCACITAVGAFCLLLLLIFLLDRKSMLLTMRYFKSQFRK